MMKIKPAPIKERIRTALEGNAGRMGYHQLMREVFPVEAFPRAWQYQSNGGPPGCAMAFGRALREMGCRTTSQGARLVYLPPAASTK